MRNPPPAGTMKDARLTGTEILLPKPKRFVREALVMPDGYECDWYYVDTPPSVMIVPLTDSREVVLVRQYRHNLKSGSFRADMPAGWLVACCLALIHGCADGVRAGHADPAEAERLFITTIIDLFTSKPENYRSYEQPFDIERVFGQAIRQRMRANGRTGNVGQKTVRFSDLSGELILDDDALARIVVTSHPELGDGPVEIEALADEARTIEKAALRVALVDIYLPGETEPRRVAMDADSFDGLATERSMAELLVTARPARRVGRPAKSPRPAAGPTDAAQSNTARASAVRPSKGNASGDGLSADDDTATGGEDRAEEAA